MTSKQWQTLLDVIRGKAISPLPVGFIIDSPWLPRWAGRSILDYFTNERMWLEANLKAVRQFPDIIFLPGFWSEFGMCTEPSAFGSLCRFPRDEFPHAEPVLADIGDVSSLRDPNPETDGLLPFMLNRLRWAHPRIEDMGHKIRFSVSRGPLNVATFLMGTTEFLMAIKTDPEPAHELLRKITSYLRKWHALQRETFPSIDGILMLDDIVGFLGEEDFLEFGLPYLRELYDVDASVKFFHNDAPCAQSVKHYPSAGINFYNPGIQSTIREIQSWTGGKLALLAGIPPRDVLAAGTPAQVRQATKDLLAGASDHSRMVWSCCGGMPMGVKTENIQAFLEAVGEASNA